MIPAPLEMSVLYAPLVADLLDSRIATLAFDERGHGADPSEGGKNVAARPMPWGSMSRYETSCSYFFSGRW